MKKFMVETLRVLIVLLIVFVCLSIYEHRIAEHKAPKATKEILELNTIKTNKQQINIILESIDTWPKIDKDKIYQVKVFKAGYIGDTPFNDLRRLKTVKLKGSDIPNWGYTPTGNLYIFISTD